MPDDTTLAHEPDAELADGLLLVEAAGQSGDWQVVADWLASHPAHAAEVLQFIDDQGKIPFRPPVAGGRFGRYQLGEMIGRGMADVYRAFDTELERDVALKLLRADSGFTPVDVARFRYEAKVVASLGHPNVVTVYDSGEANSQPYLVMPLMLAGSLADWLKKQPDHRTDPRTAAKYVRDIALGVHHAHERELIHRDLKPGNVLLDTDGTLKVADFGLARRIDATAATGEISGTVAYMAPEQARGEKGLTTAVDVYALGVILFELLTGRVPYAGLDVPGVLQRVSDGTEPVPSVSGFRPDAPADLAAVCGKCLEKRPEDRYRSAQELAQALERFLNGEPQLESGMRGWLDSARRAVVWRRELASLGSWWSLFCGAVSALIALAAIQAAVLLDAPAWVGTSAMVYYLAAWVLITRWVQKSGRGSLNLVERFAVAQQYGMMLACTAMVPWHRPLAGDVLAGVFQAFMAVVGIAIYSSGAVFWGRMYVAGLLHIGLAAAMPLFPIRYWPGVYALTSILFQSWLAVILRRIHRDGLRAQTGVGGLPASPPHRANP